MIISADPKKQRAVYVKKHIRLIGKQKEERGLSEFGARMLAQMKADLNRQASKIYSGVFNPPEGYHEVFPDKDYLKGRPELKGCRFFTCAVK